MNDGASVLGVGPRGRQWSVSPGKVAGVGEASDRAWRTQHRIPVDCGSGSAVGERVFVGDSLLDTQESRDFATVQLFSSDAVSFLNNHLEFQSKLV
jgi:hypothetical protein